MEGALGTGASFTSAMPRVTAELVAIAPTARPNTARSAAARSRRRWRILAVISLCPASYDSSITLLATVWTSHSPLWSTAFRALADVQVTVLTPHPAGALPRGLLEVALQARWVLCGPEPSLGLPGRGCAADRGDARAVAHVLSTSCRRRHRAAADQQRPFRQDTLTLALAIIRGARTGGGW